MAPTAPDSLELKAIEYETLVRNADIDTDINGYIRDLESKELAAIMGLDTLNTASEARVALTILTTRLQVYAASTDIPKYRLANDITRVINDVYKIMQIMEETISDDEKFAKYPDWYRDRLISPEPEAAGEADEDNPSGWRDRFKERVKNTREGFKERYDKAKEAASDARERLNSRGPRFARKPISKIFTKDPLEPLNEEDAKAKAQEAVNAANDNPDAAVILFAEVFQQTDIDLSTYKDQLLAKLAEGMADDIEVEFTKAQKLKLKARLTSEEDILAERVEARVLAAREIAGITSEDPNPIITNLQRSAVATTLREVQKYESSRNRDELAKAENATIAVYDVLRAKVGVDLDPEQAQKVFRLLLKPIYKQYLDGKIKQDELIVQINMLADRFSMPELKSIALDAKYNPDVLVSLLG